MLNNSRNQLSRPLSFSLFIYSMNSIVRYQSRCNYMEKSGMDEANVKGLTTDSILNQFSS